MSLHNGITTTFRSIPLGTLQYQSVREKKLIPAQSFPSIKCGRYNVFRKGNNTKTPLLAKCPFCNSKVMPFLTVISDGAEADFYVKCNYIHCAAEGPTIRNPNMAIKMWNANREIIKQQQIVDKKAQIHSVNNFIFGEIDDFTGNITIDNPPPIS